MHSLSLQRSHVDGRKSSFYMLETNQHMYLGQYIAGVELTMCSDVENVDLRRSGFRHFFKRRFR